ncbi:uncharacterized protein LOC126553892, partial [Aphis gossypii]|uniref:uncharacterized protein LOC126553892 n=1 Tax=Aphis gossypii TaxID=80765 RepID=UPI0021594DBB
ISEVERTSFKRKLTFGIDNLKKKAYPLENISHADKSPLLKRNSIDENNITQTSLFSPVMINSGIGYAEKSPLFKRNNLYESNHMQTSLFLSPAIINSDNDNGEETSFFNKKLTFRSDNSKERRNQLENNKYLSSRNSPDFSNNVVTCDLEKSTGRKSFSLCEDHDAINDKEFKKQIIRHVMYFKVELKHIMNTMTNNHYELLERVQSIEKFLEDKPTKFYDQTNLDINCMSDCSMPINNIMELNTLEDKTLGDQDFKKALINELSHVGGKNVKTAVKRIMSKLFTNCFLAEYSFTGKKGKKKFSDLFIFPIILKAIKKQVKFKSASDHEIEEPLKIYLAQAPFAEKRSKINKI